MGELEATLTIVELTARLVSDDCSLLREALSTVANFESQKLLKGQKGSRTALLTLGCSSVAETPESDLIEVVWPSESPSLSHLRSLKTLFERTLDNAHMVGGGRQSLRLSAVLKRAFKAVGGECSVRLLTTSESALIAEAEELKTVDCELKAANLECLVLLVDEQPSEHPICQFPEAAKGGGGVRCGLAAGEGRSAGGVGRATLKFQGRLEVSPINFIAVNVHRLTVKETSVALQKQSLGDSAPIKSVCSYVSPDDADLKPLDEARLTRNIKFGQQLIPLTGGVKEAIKGTSDKCLKLLGFVSQSLVPRPYFMGSVDMVSAASGSEADSRAFNSLVQALLEADKGALVRFVARQNDSPKLALLSPKITPRRQRVLCLVELPTIEDLREFNFGSTVKSSSAQQTIVSQLVEALDINAFALEEQREIGLLSRNPFLEALEERLLELGVAGERGGERREGPEQAGRKRVKTETVEAIRSGFRLSENEARAEGTRRVFWSELLGNQELEERRRAEKGKDGEPEPVRDISRETPVSDFREMLRNRREDLVGRAVEQMSQLIVELSQSAWGGSNLERAMELLAVLREGCVAEDEPDQFNELVEELRDEVSLEPGAAGLLEAMRERGTRLISSRESHRSRVSEEAAAQFVTAQRAPRRRRRPGEKTGLMDLLE